MHNEHVVPGERGFTMAKYLAVSLDGEGQFFSPVKGSGKAHLITVNSAERGGGDFLALADNGKVNKWCGGKLTASNLESGISSAVCGKCAAFVDSPEYREEIERAAEAWAVESAGTGESVLDLAGEVTQKDTTVTKGAKPRHNREVDMVAYVTDGKCAFEQENEETGETELVTVNGRMRIAPVDGSESCDQNGNSVGVCPVCRQVAKLTNSGAIGTHRPSNITPDSSPLPGRALDWKQADGRKVREAEVSGRGEDASEIRESLTRTRDRLDMVREGLEVATHPEELESLESRRVAGLAQERELVAKLRGAEMDWKSQDEGQYAPGVRDHGRSDGVGMLPLGETGFAGMRFDDTNEHATGDGVARTPGVSSLGKPKVVGGRNGFLTEAQYGELSRSQRRNYWRKIKKMDDRGKAARVRRKDLRERGFSVPRGEGPNATRPYASVVDGVRMDAKPQTTKGSTLNGQSATIVK